MTCTQPPVQKAEIPESAGWASSGSNFAPISSSINLNGLTLECTMDSSRLLCNVDGNLIYTKPSMELDRETLLQMSTTQALLISGLFNSKRMALARTESTASENAPWWRNYVGTEKTNRSSRWMLHKKLPFQPTILIHRIFHSFPLKRMRPQGNGGSWGNLKIFPQQVR